eukprot:gene2372-8072_t
MAAVIPHRRMLTHTLYSYVKLSCYWQNLRQIGTVAPARHKLSNISHLNNNFSYYALLGLLGANTKSELVSAPFSSSQHKTFNQQTLNHRFCNCREDDKYYAPLSSLAQTLGSSFVRADYGSNVRRNPISFHRALGTLLSQLRTTATYYVHVTTADYRGAGISSNALLLLKGNRNSLETTLAPATGRFERGICEKFVLTISEDLGCLDSLHIAPETAPQYNGWLLESVIVEHVVDSQVTEAILFPCNRWLGLTDEGELEACGMMLYPSTLASCHEHNMTKHAADEVRQPKISALPEDTDLNYRSNSFQNDIRDSGHSNFESTSTADRNATLVPLSSLHEEHALQDNSLHQSVMTVPTGQSGSSPSNFDHMSQPINPASIQNANNGAGPEASSSNGNEITECVSFGSNSGSLAKYNSTLDRHNEANSCGKSTTGDTHRQFPEKFSSPMLKEPLAVKHTAVAIPHPAKVRSGRKGKCGVRDGKAGEDAYAIRINTSHAMIAVADGVHAWADHNIDSGEMAQALVEACGSVFEKTDDSHPLAILDAAWSDVSRCGMVQGSSTILLITISLDTGELMAATLGDSTFIVLRPRQQQDKADNNHGMATSYSALDLRNRQVEATSSTSNWKGDAYSPSATSSPSSSVGTMTPLYDVMPASHSLSLPFSDAGLQWRSGDSSMRPSDVVLKGTIVEHFFGKPYQLGHHNGSDSPRNAAIQTAVLQPGDTVVCGTDGLFDNLHDRQIMDIVAAESPPWMSSRTLANEAFNTSLDKNATTPWSQVANEELDMFYTGGKQDDITVVTIGVLSRQQRRRSWR